MMMILGAGATRAALRSSRSPRSLHHINNFKIANYSNLTANIPKIRSNPMNYSRAACSISSSDDGICEIKSVLRSASFAIPVKGDQVDIIQSPGEFYANINVRVIP